MEPLPDLLDQFDDPNLRAWNAERDVGNGWSRQVLEQVSVDFVEVFGEVA